MGNLDFPGHTPGTRKGEEIKEDDKKAGRHGHEDKKGKRTSGDRTARDSTGVNPHSVESVTGGPEMPPA